MSYESESAAIDKVKAFQHDIDDDDCSRCGAALYGGCPVCAANEVDELKERVKELEKELWNSLERETRLKSQLGTVLQDGLYV